MENLINISAKDVTLIKNKEDLSDFGEAIASISLNPNVAWLKFVLTDNQPNANNHLVPKDEFANIKRTALFMPFKMAEGKIEDTHANSKPLGTIAHIIEKDNYIEALAALWEKERPEDVKYLRERYENGQSIDVSWELSYDVNASINRDDGILELHGIDMNAVTIVGLPSYQGRTGVTQMASQNKTGDNNTMADEKNLISREDHDTIVSGLQTKLDEALNELKVLRPLKAELEDLKPKYDELDTFKKEYDQAKANVEKLATIRQKFVDAGIERDDKYFDERKEKFLAMDDAALDFFLQELIVMQEEEASRKNENASVNLTGNQLPDIRGNGKSGVTREDVVKYLNDLDNPKKE